jgi:LysR family transcriptional regulator, low CO2-responsive transcriptional regulator
MRSWSPACAPRHIMIQQTVVVNWPITDSLSRWSWFIIYLAPQCLRCSAVTLNQLKVFLLVARLGSFRAAAQTLGISEPAVSQAIAALRQSLGDQLLSRTSAGIELTAAGQRIIGLASQMVNLSLEAEAAVRQAQGGPELLRVVSSATPAEGVIPALLQAFMHRATNVEATLGIATGDAMGALLTERLADVAIGPRLAGAGLAGVVSEPLLRYRLIIVARSKGNAQPVANLQQLAYRDWFVDPSGQDPTSDVGRLLVAAGVAEKRISVFPNQRAAWAAAATGDAVAPAVEHLFMREPHFGLSAITIPAFPMENFWHINSLAGDRRSPVASQLYRFVAQPDAMQAMFREDGRVPASKFKPPVYVTIWS